VAGVTSLLQYASADGIATITLDSPHNRNALSTQLMADVVEHLGAATRDDTVRVVVLSHTGAVFCSGADLRETEQAGSAGLPVSAMPALLQALWDCPKPVIARVAGPARAGGLGIIGACDAAVVASDATFAFSEVRLGVVPAVISATVLPRLTSRAASELFLTGAVFDGERAASIGLATIAVPLAEVDAMVQSYAEAILRGGPNAIAATKRLLRRPTSDELRADLERLTPLSQDHFTSPEGREGVAARREKRDPSWVAGT
jgi:methylglutaconyl-CoA hydratase